MNQIITEIGGRLLSAAQNYNRIPSRLIPPNSYFDPQQHDLQRRDNLTKSLRSYNDLDSWQQAVYRLVRDKHDCLVNISPAGGKTKPIVFAWQDTFGNDRQHDSILWITPTVQLANQVFHVDLKESLLNRISRWRIGDGSEFPTQLLPPQIQHIIYQYHRTNGQNLKLDAEQVNILNHWLTHTAMVLKAGGGSQGELSANTIVAVCTYEYANDIIVKQRPKIVVVDELQQYYPIEKKNEESTQNEASALMNIFRNTPKESVLILLTGSQNCKTSEEIVKCINTYFGRNLTIYPPNCRVENNPPGNRASISIVPFNKMSSQKDRIEIIKNAVRNRDAGNCMILFSAKGTNPEFIFQNALFPIAKQLSIILPKRSIKQVCSVEIPENKDLYRDNRFDNSNFKLNPNSIDYNYYHPQDNIHPNRVSLSNATRIIRGRPEDPLNMAYQLDNMLSNGVMPGEYEGSSQSAPHDRFLAECILCGFAYLGNGRMKGFRMHNDDIMLVQNLFKQGRIYFLLATDMIGVGTTLTIRKLYLPDLNKFKSPEIPYGKIDDSSLVQLINRVGRQTSVAATIYCQPDDYQKIYTMMNLNPAESVSPALAPNMLSPLENKSLPLIDKVKMILMMLRS